jgi:hypothetical protein
MDGKAIVQRGLRPLANFAPGRNGLVAYAMRGRSLVPDFAIAVN